LADLSRLSLNQATTQYWPTLDTLRGCVDAGVRSIGLWRHKVDEIGLERAAQAVREQGLNVSSLCRGGFFPAPTEQERQQRLDDNRRAIDEAVALGTDVLVLVCGPPPDRDIRAARQMVEDGIAALLPYAAERRVRLAIEPLHPTFAADRSVVVTLRQANDTVERLDSPWVGVAVDVYHVWWDPEVEAQIARAAGRILGFHVSDWLVPPPDHLLGRGLMGDGVIDLPRLRACVEAAGYQGPIEVEIFNQQVWDTPGEQVLEQIKRRFVEFV
jgi:sugar phosphate isomerase/epimerase